MAYSTKSSDRRSHKPGINREGNRRRRNETTIQIRKSRRAAGLLRRRNLDSTCDDNAASASAPSTSVTALLSSFFSERNINLSRDVLHLLTKSESSSMTSSSASASNTMNATNTNTNTITPPSNIELELAVLSSGVGPYLLSLLNTTNRQAAPVDLNLEECILCVGNIAGESCGLRDHLLKHGAMPILTNMVKSIVSTQMPSHSQLQLLEKTVWCISNLCRGRPKPNHQQISIAIFDLCNLLHTSTGDVLTNVCWALSYLTDGTCAGSNEAVLMLYSKDYAGIFPRLLSLLNEGDDAGSVHESRSVLACLQILSNVVSSNGFNMDHISVGELVERISKLLTDSTTRDVCVEALFLLSSIAEGGGKDCISIIMSSPTVIPILLEVLGRGHQDVKLECLWVIGNISSGGSEEQLQRLVQLGVIPLLCQNLELCNAKTILMILDAVDDILIAGERLGEDYRSTLDANGFVDMIESLQTHLNDDVYRRAVEIIESHFGGDDDDDDVDTEDYDYWE